MFFLPVHLSVISKCLFVIFSQMVNQKVDAKYPDTIGIVYDDWNSKVSLVELKKWSLT